MRTRTALRLTALLRGRTPSQTPARTIVRHTLVSMLLVIFVSAAACAPATQPSGGSTSGGGKSPSGSSSTMPADLCSKTAPPQKGDEFYWHVGVCQMVANGATQASADVNEPEPWVAPNPPKPYKQYNPDSLAEISINDYVMDKSGQPTLNGALEFGWVVRPENSEGTIDDQGYLLHGYGNKQAHLFVKPTVKGDQFATVACGWEWRGSARANVDFMEDKDKKAQDPNTVMCHWHNKDTNQTPVIYPGMPVEKTDNLSSYKIQYQTGGEEGWHFFYNGTEVGYFDKDLWANKGEQFKQFTVVRWWGEVHEITVFPTHSNPCSQMGNGQYGGVPGSAHFANLAVTNANGSTADVNATEIKTNNVNTQFYRIGGPDGTPFDGKPFGKRGFTYGGTGSGCSRHLEISNKEDANLTVKAGEKSATGKFTVTNTGKDGALTWSLVKPAPLPEGLTVTPMTDRLAPGGHEDVKLTFKMPTKMPAFPIDLILTAPNTDPKDGAKVSVNVTIFLQSVDWQNYTYTVGKECGLDASRQVTLTGGQAKDDKSYDIPHYWRINAPVAYSNLAGDGRDEAAIAFSCGWGTNQYSPVYVFTGDGKSPQLLGIISAKYGDRFPPIIQSLKISGQQIQLSGLGYSPSAPHASPDVKLVFTYKWDGATFKQTNVQAAPIPTPTPIAPPTTVPAASCTTVPGFANAGSAADVANKFVTNPAVSQPSVPFPAQSLGYVKEAYTRPSVDQPGFVYHFERIAVCSPATAASSVQAFFTEHMPGASWSQSDTFPYGGKFNSACGDQYCWSWGAEASDVNRFASLEINTVRDVGSNRVMYEVLLAVLAPQ